MGRRRRRGSDGICRSLPHGRIDIHGLQTVPTRVRTHRSGCDFRPILLDSDESNDSIRSDEGRSARHCRHSTTTNLARRLHAALTGTCTTANADCTTRHPTRGRPPPRTRPFVSERPGGTPHPRQRTHLHAVDTSTSRDADGDARKDRNTFLSHRWCN